jgi:aryl-phospho-beta-D-glucosidase BglC (GH1 family)
VLSPHTYGPDVYVKPTFNALAFPANLNADWEQLFGQFASIYTIVPGEWGGRYGHGGDPRDAAWQNAFVDYLLSKGIRNSFYWCYTPNSGDTGGILDDNLAVHEGKMAMLRRLWGDASTASVPPATSSTPVAQNPGAPPDSGSTAPVGGGGAADLWLLLALATAALMRRRTARRAAQA